MNRSPLIRRLAIAAIAAGMLTGAALGMADRPAAQAGPSLRAASTEDGASTTTRPGDLPPTKPWRITAGLEELQPAKPMSRAEADSDRVTRYGLDNGAIAITFDPDTDVLSVLFPLGSTPPPPPRTKLNVSVRVAEFPSPAYDAAASDLTSFEWAPDLKGKYSYGISLDAATGLITVETDAPAEVTDIIAARHPGIFRFTKGAPMRLASLQAAGPAPADR
jgi:hypothetical protein